ncbi:hypothetical protein DUNSADRAFT_9319 [Dunaliella salina]|uniref:Uncharacterized protein n=1 Tax=Dunaliella salina TaxID=3046 RepID=A0ABQ7GHN5_DUNSA|nr:hypothetical protein DUNSADRAFT_9319 [Dunaliella salina]|eukprot:KAF5834123.1 hypothetical protein DUNSADRAFT_9319 [Dunaliella salina]
MDAIALVTGRLLVLLRGDEKLSQACLPLLMDAVTMQPLTSNVKAGATQQEAAMFACFTRTIAAMAVAGACKHALHDWAYEQIMDLLIRLYRDHNTPGSSNREAADVRGACLASAITRMAEGIAAGMSGIGVALLKVLQVV